MVVYSMMKTTVKAGVPVAEPEWVTSEPHGRHLCEHAIIHNKWIVNAIMRDHDIWSHDHDTFNATSKSPGALKKGQSGAVPIPQNAKLLLTVEMECADSSDDAVNEDMWLPTVLALYEQEGAPASRCFNLRTSSFQLAFLAPLPLEEGAG